LPIEYRGKPAADGARYRVLGNAMAVPVIRWILGRVKNVAEIVNEILG
jgi:DNA (cytosine-5)-methyltransferase 1